MSSVVSPVPSSRRRLAPGPKGHPLLGMLPQFRGDRLGFIGRLAQPSFHKQRLAGFAGIMSSSAADFVERLGQLGAGGAAFDVVPELSRLTLRILGRCLFERDLTDQADAVGSALGVVLHHTIEKLGALFPPPRLVPTPKNLRFRAALRALDRVVLS